MTTHQVENFDSADLLPQELRNAVAEHLGTKHQHYANRVLRADKRLDHFEREIQAITKALPAPVDDVAPRGAEHAGPSITPGS
jgi:hypothetical protein